MLSLRSKFAAALAVGAVLAVSQAKAADPVLPTEPKPATHVTVGSPGCCDCDSCCEQHFRVWGELLYISPRNLNIAFAAPVAGCGSTDVVGPIAQVSPDDTFTFRVGGEYAVNCNTSIGLTYSRLHDTEEAVASAAEGQELRALVAATDLNCIDNGDVLAAGARFRFEYDIIDADVRNVLYSCNNVNVVWLIGARWMRLEQDFESEFVNLGSTFITSNVKMHNGYGPRIGLEGEIGLCSGLSAYAKGAASFVYGKWDATFDQEDTFVGTQVSTSFKQERVMTMLDFEAGLAWTSCNGCLRVAAGFMVSQWYNAVTVPGVIEAVQNGRFDRHENNLNDLIQIEGGVLRVEFRF
jgi:major outer membrane protein